MESASLAFSSTKAAPSLEKQWIRNESRRLRQRLLVGLKAPERGRGRTRTVSRMNVAVRQAVTPFISESLTLGEVEAGNCHREPVRREALDEWMNSSVTEIVRSVGEAPLLVHVYSEEEEKPRLEKEKAKAESWPRVVRRWKEGCPLPDGVILVEQLNGDQVVDLNIDEQKSGHDGSNFWGILVQGRGLDCAACYILKTDKVQSSQGVFCTYFCLVRASCFGETADLQFRNSWLVRTYLSQQRQQ